jgi:hypothetical protein
MLRNGRGPENNPDPEPRGEADKKILRRENGGMLIGPCCNGRMFFLTYAGGGLFCVKIQNR